MFVGSDPDDYCYYTHFGLIDMHWQLDNPPNETDQIDFYIDCLKSHDIEPAHNEPITEPGDAQTEQLTDLEQQEADNNIDCGYTDPRSTTSPTTISPSPLNNHSPRTKDVTYETSQTGVDADTHHRSAPGRMWKRQP